MMTLRSVCALSLGAALAGFVAIDSTRADDIHWTWNPGDGGISFFDAANWTPAQVPGSADNAIFGSADGLPRGAVVDTDSAQVSRFNVTRGGWTFTVDAGQSLTAAGHFNIDGDHSLRVTLRGDGQYIAQITRLNSDLSGSSGAFDRCTVTFAGAYYDGRGIDRDIPGAGLFDVGGDGGGAIAIANAGAQILADYVRIGESGGQGNFKLSGAGTQLTAANGMQVGAGAYSIGEFVMELGAHAELGHVALANYGPTGIANAVISGSGTQLNTHTFDISGDQVGDGVINVGESGTGLLIVADQAHVTCQELIVATESTGDGQVTIMDADTRIDAALGIVVGRDVVDGDSIQSGAALMTVDESAVVATPYLQVGAMGSLKVAPGVGSSVGGMIAIGENPDEITLTAGTIHVAQTGVIRTAGRIEGNLLLEGELTVHYSDDVGEARPTSATVIGDITVHNGVIVFDLTQNAADHLAVQGTVTFSEVEGEEGWINVASHANFTPTLGQTYELLRADAIVGAPSFMWFNDGGMPEGWDLQLNVNDGVVSVTIIPEPTTIALLSLAAGASLIRRRRA